MEEKLNKLPCIISDKNQTEVFLSVLSRAWNSHQKMKEDYCSTSSVCYGEEIPSLDKCSGIIYDKLIFPFNNNQTISKSGHSQVQHCLKLVWPFCPANVSLLTLPFLYVPLGISQNNILKEDDGKKCVLNQITHITNAPECQADDYITSLGRIMDCLGRHFSKLKKYMANLTSKRSVHWSVDKIITCFTTQTVTRCKHSDWIIFQLYFTSVLDAVNQSLVHYKRMFDDPLDVKTADDCISQFYSEKFNSCIPLVSQFIKNYNDGNASISDYPSQCIEDVFGICNSSKTFHSIIKKYMNVADDEIQEVCLDAKPGGYHLNSCPAKSLSYDSACVEDEILNSEEEDNTLKTMKKCQRCAIQKIDDICLYNDYKDLIATATQELQSFGKCLKRRNSIQEGCIVDIIDKVKNKCIENLHTFTHFIKIGSLMRAAEVSKAFDECVQRSVQWCPNNTSEMISNIYRRILGQEQFSVISSSVFGDLDLYWQNKEQLSLK
ncbi:uncharacterized protein LOC118205793 isoform X2 [Stegodyphus dumicola]|uniref:uncharacterized protein LOC118205793 isoform X2 n=1 Tax=Stegodyphus dumicola TaxID=202533 RepID=UPI0015AB71A3|nr:uncharacterized protein LOC118205793 isoform X2 [Stegodyphus dumicola]